MKGVTLENEYAYINEGKVFLKGYLNMPDRQIGEVKNTPEEAFEYFEKRFEIALAKVNQLQEDIETMQNKGSYLTKLQQLRKRLLNFDGIGNFIPLLEKLDSLEVYLQGLIEENQKLNLELKRQLIEAAKQHEYQEDWKPIAEELQEIKTRWIKTGPADKAHNDALEEEFRSVLDTFFQTRNAHFEEQNREIQEKIDKYNELINKAIDLETRSDWDEAFLDLKNYQTEWKIVGNIPPKVLKALYKIFRQHTSAFYEKYCEAKGIQPKRRSDPRIEAQLNMVKEVEDLTLSEDMVTATTRAKVLLNQWKTIRVPSHLADRSVAERFRTACDKIFELSYLYKVIGRKYPTFNFLNERQKDLTKYREMENIVKRARTDFDDLTASYHTQDYDEEMDRMLQNNLKTQKRKLLMKEIILEELRARASES